MGHKSSRPSAVCPGDCPGSVSCEAFDISSALMRNEIIQSQHQKAARYLSRYAGLLCLIQGNIVQYPHQISKSILAFTGPGQFAGQWQELLYPGCKELATIIRELPYWLAVCCSASNTGRKSSQLVWPHRQDKYCLCNRRVVLFKRCFGVKGL